ncbi:transposase, partial [Sinorhizobium medicae]
KAIAALAGLAPFNVDSGTSRGKRHIRGGRKRIRDALYMAALTASRMPRAFKSHADQMKEAGKPFKVVIIALARKLLASQTPSSGTKQPSDEPPDKHSCQPVQSVGLENPS